MEETTVIVTAASSNHFKSVMQLIESIPPQIKVLFYDIGLTIEERQSLQSTFPTVSVKIFDFERYPIHVHLTSQDAGAYAWKPIIIDEVYNSSKDTDVLLWCDAGDILNADIYRCIETVKNNKIYTATSSGNISRWTHPTSIHNLQIPSEHLGYNMRNAAFVGLLCNDETVKSFVNEWKTLSLDKDVILPAGANRSNHRHDQSILTYLYYKFNIPNVDYYIGYSIHNDIDGT
jgi:hypothetical protein